MSIHGVLGEHTSYPKTYAPQVLYPIARSLGRKEIAAIHGCSTDFIGIDVWQIFELSWLNKMGVSQVAMARLLIPAHSPNIVESKSLKLYFNSLNFTVFSDVHTLKEAITRDLSTCVGANVTVEVLTLDDACMHTASPVGICIDAALDNAEQVLLTDDIDSSLLGRRSPADVEDSVGKHSFYCNLLRSNCPVTNQPDWGTLQVVMAGGVTPNYQAILRYLLSFRQHNGFHEQCVERIFADFTARYAPKKLLVQANYTRRGGIDINPIRTNDATMLHDMAFGRLVRQ